MATNPFDAIFNQMSPEEVSNVTAPELRKFRKVYGDVKSTQPNYHELFKEKYSSLRDPSELVKVPVDLAMMGTVDLYNKANAGFDGIYAGAKEYLSSGDIDKAIAEALSGVKHYKAPNLEGAIQRRPHSKVLGEIFEPVGEATDKGAEIGEKKLGIPAELTKGVVEFGMDMLMGKGGTKLVENIKAPAPKNINLRNTPSDGIMVSELKEGGNNAQLDFQNDGRISSIPKLPTIKPAVGDKANADYMGKGKEAERFKEWSKDLPVKSEADWSGIKSPEDVTPGIYEVSSAQTKDLQYWDKNKAKEHSELNTTGSFWGAEEQAAKSHADDHGVDRELDVDKYFVRAENPTYIKSTGAKSTQAAMEKAKVEGHDVAIIDNGVSRYVTHLDPHHTSSIKSKNNLGTFTESPYFKLGVATAAGLGYLASDDDHRALAGGLLAGTIGRKPFYSAVAKAVESPKFGEAMKAQSIEPFLKKMGATADEIKMLKIPELVKDKGAQTKVTRQELQDHIESKSVKYGEDVYGNNDYKQKYNEAAGQRTMTLRKIRDKVVEFDRVEGVDTMPSDAMAFVNLQTLFNFRDIRSTYPQLSELVDKYIKEDKIASELYDSVKDPQFSDHQAIKSKEGVLPDSYTEEFVTAENTGDSVHQKAISDLKQQLKDEESMVGRGTNRYIKLKDKLDKLERRSPDKSWKDEHSDYRGTKNPLIRFRYDVKEYPDGKKTMRIQELQDPKRVREGRSGKGPVPQELATRARAKELGVDGIEWSTGEQQKDLYNSALRSIADEARWNPETQELTVYKDGTKTHSYPNTPKKKIEDYIGKTGAQRLLENKVEVPTTENLQEINRFNNWMDEVHGRNWTVSELSSFERSTYDKLHYSNQHIATDLSIDAKWPKDLYGDFSENATDHVSRDEMLEFLRDSEFAEFLEERPEKEWTTEELRDHYNALQVIPSSITKGSGNFQQGIVGNLLKKYGKGEFGVTEGSGYKVERIRDGDYAIVGPQGKRYKTGRYYNTRAEAEAELESYKKEGMLSDSGNGQPVMWFTNKTPTEFPMYEGVTSIFSMLQSAVQASGGGAKGVAIVAAKYGIPAALVAKYLSGDNETKEKLLDKYPQLKGKQYN